MPSLRTLLTTITTLGLCSASLADTLAHYAITDQVISPTISDPKVTGSTISWGAGLAVRHRGFGYANNSLYARASIVDEPISADSTDYIEFTLDANPGYVLQLANLSFGFGFTHANQPASQTAEFALRSSADGYATDLARFTKKSIYGNVDESTSGPIALSAAAFQNISTITFRIYFTDDGVNTNDYTLRLDAIDVQGLAVTGRLP